MYRDLLAEQRNSVVGIDLGTTNSLIAIATDCSARVFASPTGAHSLPSVASFDDARGGIIVGHAARQAQLARPRHTVSSIKRFMGMNADEASRHAGEVNYSLSNSNAQVASVRLGERDYSAPEISALYLRELKRWAELDLGKPVQQAVITVPAYFNDAQRQATRDAGKIAGLDVLRIVNEPTAAALAYGLDHLGKGLVAVYDFGGGTFDVSILRLSEGVFEVLATGGDTRLGGDDIDWAVASALYAQAHGKGGNLRDASPEARQALVRACELCKIELSRVSETTVDAPAAGVQVRLSRAQLEAIAAPIIARTLDICRRVIADSRIALAGLDEVLLVGGSSRMPLVQREVAALFGRVPRYDIDPEQVVALGAAVQGRILAGGLRHMLLLDVTPLSLGIETWGGAFDVIVPRNTTLPTSAQQTFTTNVDGQTRVMIHVLQGERELAEHNRSLGRLILSDLPPMPAGAPKIVVDFALDADGLLSVTAREERTGQTAQIEIQPSSGLSEDEVKRIIGESFTHAADDFERRIVLDRSNEAQGILRAVDKALVQSAEMIDADYRREVETAAAALRSALAAKDAGRIKRDTEALSQKTEELARLQMNAVLSATVKGRTLDEV